MPDARKPGRAAGESAGAVRAVAEPGQAAPRAAEAALRHRGRVQEHRLAGPATPCPALCRGKRWLTLRGLTRALPTAALRSSALLKQTSPRYAVLRAPLQLCVGPVNPARLLLACQVDEMEKAVDVAERNMARFGLSQQEISSRKRWVQQTRRQVHSRPYLGRTRLDFQSTSSPL